MEIDVCVCVGVVGERGPRGRSHQQRVGMLLANARDAVWPCPPPPAQGVQGCAHARGLTVKMLIIEVVKGLSDRMNEGGAHRGSRPIGVSWGGRGCVHQAAIQLRVHSIPPPSPPWRRAKPRHGRRLPACYACVRQPSWCALGRPPCPRPLGWQPGSASGGSGCAPCSRALSAGLQARKARGPAARGRCIGKKLQVGERRARVHACWCGRASIHVCKALKAFACMCTCGAGTRPFHKTSVRFEQSRCMSFRNPRHAAYRCPPAVGSGSSSVPCCWGGREARPNNLLASALPCNGALCAGLARYRRCVGPARGR